MSGELAYLGLAEAAELIRAKKLSPVEYATALLARIERHDGRYNAFIALTPERALKAARAAEAEITAGRWRGPFHVVPYALKDIIDVEGLATTAHSKILKGNIARRHAVVTERLEAAGGVLLGKLSTHEFAIGGPSFDLPWPPARNPWNRDHFCGGSSSGSGAGLAAGFFPAALGTDTGGSIRTPASMCGITGMKATYGRVSRRGVAPLAFSLDHIGPMTRTVRDNALMLQVIAGHDPGDPGSADDPVPDYGALLGQDVRGLRIGVIRHFYTGDVAGDPEQVEALDIAVKLLAEAGAEISEITLPALAGTPCVIEAPFEGLRFGIFVEVGTDVDKIAGTEALAANYWRQARMPFNVTGQPGLVIPAGFTKSGLPLSLQLVGHPFGEAVLYRVAQFYEDATGWTKRHPPGLSE